MIIKSIDLQNFRNYGLQGVEFDGGTNILYGDNAQGKTNILEAVYVAGTTKSHRGSKDFEMISFGHDEAHIKAVICKKNIDHRIDMHIKKNKSKGIAVNGVPIKKSTELYGIVNIIFFSPEDLNIIKSGPAQRRKFMDMELCQLDRIYVSNLVSYNRAVDQRNKLLRDIGFRPELEDTLDVWDSQLVRYGTEIIRRRQGFINRLNGIIEEIHSGLTGGKEKLKITYESSVKPENFEMILRENRSRDIKLKMTCAGPHRDDICFMISKADIRRYGSQGQQRTTALSLKLSEIELVKEAVGDTPILLLDDVLSELDGSRQNHLLNSINGVQTIITCTGLDEFINNRFDVNRVFNVTGGQVYRKSRCQEAAE